MAEYTGPATDNEAVVIENNCGRIVPDRYATGDNDDKMQSAHPKRVHNDIYQRYGSDSPISDPC